MERRLDAPPPLTSQLTNDRLDLVAAGSWTARQAAEIDTAIDGILTSGDTHRAFSLDMSRVDQLDTFGACLLNRLEDGLTKRGSHPNIIELPETFAGLRAAVRFPADALVGPRKMNPLLHGLERIGRAASTLATDLPGLVNMLGAVGHALARVAVRPTSFRLTSTVHQLDRVGWQAVPIILLITFLIGGIIAQQGFFHFRKFGADQYVVDMVGLLVLREIGVLLVAIMVAGRSGSSYTAELGSMKMREEIDALRTMGLDPVGVLILPRILALVIALPALTFLGSMAALFGGGVIASLYGDMAPDIFIARLKEAVSLTHFKVGMIKAPFMALVIGLVACTEGLKVKGSAESLGLQTTASVVKSIFLVIVLDGLFAIYFASIGM
ncbi:MAG: ABC transporter permease [Hyphomicrobiaceae bacterium]|nr:MAG: ABC transporter permease [Hyphomicrobiaceae bacterium]